MTAIELTSFKHAAIRLVKDGSTLAIDPGNFSDPAVLEGADAVLITHEHPDHVVPELVAKAVNADEKVHVWAPDTVAEALVEAGAPKERVHVPVDGQTIEAAGFRIEPRVTDHAEILPHIPIITNVAYLIEGAILHPGDSLTVVPDDLQVLLVPIAAPWSRAAMVHEYVAQVSPAKAVPIHDAILSDQGKGIWDNVVGGNVPESTQFQRLQPGETLTVEV